MLYFDKKLREYESNYLYHNSLLYLENLYNELKTTDLLNSLITFSWYYYIDGPIDSGKYGEDDTKFPLKIWKKYVNYVINSNYCEPSTLYFCGYTLSLHGFLIGKEMEIIGKRLINNALACCNEEKLKELIEAFKIMDCQKKYKPVKISKDTLLSLFDNESMVGKYFIDLYIKE